MKDDFYFIPILYFDNPVFDELIRIIKERKVINTKEKEEYVFQLKISLYVTFNEYINLLLIKRGEEELENLLYQLETEENKNSDEIFAVLEKYIGENKEQIIEGFLQYFNK